MVVCSKVARFGQIDDFSCSFTKWATFCNFLLKSRQKRRNMVVSSKSCKFRPNRWFFVIFHEMSHFFHLFAEKLTKTRKHGSLPEKLQLLAKSMMFQQKVSHFVKKHEKSSIWPKLTTSRANYHAWAFWWAFQQKVAKSGWFLEKERKIIHLAETCNFSRKQPCFGVLVNFSGKSCKK